LSLNFNGVFGNDIYNNLANVLDGLSLFDSGYNIMKSATKLKESVENSLDYSDRYIENGSYLRLTSATLSYMVPLKPNNYIKGLTLSLTGNNLFCITSYSGYDPEVDSYRATDGIPALGVGWTNYPMARSFTLGASINF
jgi:iron complex outermembrane receptor protein